MATKRKSGTKRKTSRSQQFRRAVLGKPRGVIQPRVRKVGPEHFGVVAVDCAKDVSKWLLADFYGEVFVKPTHVDHSRAGFQAAVEQLKKAIGEHHIRDLIVAVEMTGTYHKPIQRAFRKAGFETRLVHPFASSFYRLPEHGDVKTDDHDLAAIFRAAVNGFGLLENEPPPLYQELQVLVRHRRDLVNKKAKLQCQIRHHLELCLPGFAALFPNNDLWRRGVPLPLLKAIAEHGGTPKVVLDAKRQGVEQWLRQANVCFQQRTIDRVLVWANNAPESHPNAKAHTRVWQALIEDWEAKKRQITAIERDYVRLLAKTPYLLLLSHPGINVISAAELAGEVGPIEHYASASAMRGRAGLFPSRYQSDQVDRGGNLSRFRNARQRRAWILIAENLLKCNRYWRKKVKPWRDRGVASRDIRLRVANRITRLVFQIVSGRKLYQHPSRLQRSYVMEKILQYHLRRETPPDRIVGDLEEAAVQIPSSDQKEEAQPLKKLYDRGRQRRRRTTHIGVLLVGVLAKLGLKDLESK